MARFCQHGCRRVCAWLPHYGFDQPKGRRHRGPSAEDLLHLVPRDRLLAPVLDAADRLLLPDVAVAPDRRVHHVAEQLRHAVDHRDVRLLDRPILELPRLRRDSHVMQVDVCRVASFYMHEWAGVAPIPGDPKPR